ncbi:S8 family serine peptidase [Brasilonema bromeliae]|uniref:Peptidase S8 n=1 Tax=Brasilonema bromeliae SPC951 TaxID=385972 RepID=A0ABX1PH68_9CYAN|nr:S8 family serine peptidase [Brasilonema bromeliae]NMG22921.1 peptidase S8 [Brasilonema bromeliae SPC951]
MFTRISSNSSLFNQGQNITSLSSVNTFDYNNNYNVNLNGHSSFNSAINDLENNAEEQLFNDNGYSFTSGYGLINAAAAVAKAAGQTTFADVPKLGGNNWGADLVKAPEAWAKGYTGQGVVVAVLDTGVDFNHDDLKDNIWTNSKEITGNGIDDDGDGFIDDVHGWNFVDNNNDVSDKFGHGTHVSGTIAGEKNDIGVTGIAYGAKIMPVKVLNDEGSGSYTSISNGIYYAVDHGANVINLSLVGGSSDSTLEKAVEYASSKGVIVVMAAGNDSGFQPGYPARYADKWGIAVGAVNKNNNMADFSNKAAMNSLTYVTAPGVNVYSTIPGNKYASYNGTSMATPHVAGVVALMLSANHSLTDAQVRQIVAETAVHDTQVPNFSLGNFVTKSSATISSFSVTDYHDGSYGSQDQLDDSNTVQFSGFSVSSTLSSQFSSYQTLLNNLNYSITDYDDTTVSENILKQRQEMLEENFRMVS